MTTPSSVANGARLDDCHSNIFSLADLSGIRWQKFSSAAALGLTDDPVLAAFTKCLAHDILAVWRRAPKKSCNNKDILFEKELWIFWWGDEPSVDIICQQRGLKDEANGSWDEGLTYECRTLLFKAIHNLIERCLLNENFVRIGRWFIKPFCKDNDDDISDRFSFSFSFFLHGESSLCTTVEVAKHQNLERLSYQYVQQVLSNIQQNKSVILAPYGLKAQLTGRVYRSPHEPIVKKLMEEWKPFYPLGSSEDSLMDDEYSDDDVVDDHIPVPPVVEVTIDGIPMNYPSYYVLVLSGSEKTGLSSEPTTKYSYSPAACDRADTTALSSERTPGGGVMSVSSSFEHTPVALCRQEAFPNHCQTDTSTINEGKPIRDDLSKLSTSVLNRVRSANHLDHKKLQDLKPSNTSDGQLEFPDQSEKGNSSYKIPENQKDLRASFSFQLHRGDDYKIEKLSKGFGAQSFHHRLSVSDGGSSHTRPSTTYANSGEPLASNSLEHNLATLPTPVGFEPFKGHLQTSHFDGRNMDFSEPHRMSKNNLTTKPFVNIINNNNNQTWVSEDHGEAGRNSTSVGIQEDVVELKRPVFDWSTYKLPNKSEEELHHLTKRSMVLCDNLDPGNNVGFTNRLYSSHFKCYDNRGPMLKRRKMQFEEKENCSEDRANNILTSSDNFSSVYHQPVLGPVKGELAGMVVPTDPYAFDDEADDTPASNAILSSDINLKHSSVLGPKSTLHGVLMSDQHVIKTEGFPTGKSQLETLLTNNYSPIGATDTTSAPTSIGKMSESDLKFSMDDLKDMFDEEDESGAPTPPDDGDGLHHAIKHMLPCVISNTVNSNVDLQRIYPTPPSHEPYQPFSPDGRQPVVTSVLPTEKTESALFSPQEQNSAASCKPGVLSDVDFQDLSKPDKTVHSNSNSKSLDLDSKLKVAKHPTPSEYLPIKCLSSVLPLNSVSYTPTWQLPPIEQSPQPMFSMINPSDLQSMMSSSSAPPVSGGTPSSMGMFPSTPGKSNNKMSAPQFPAQSPLQRSGGRGGIRSVDPSESPASSATPHSHVTPRRLYCDQHGNAAIFMNLLLSDSVLNVFRDHSFDLCALCVCNTNITGVDVEYGYLPALSTKEDQFPCSCGFSAIRNRMASVGCGLFLEDELDVVGKPFQSNIIEYHNNENHSNDIKLSNKILSANENIIQYILDSCSSPFFDIGSMELSENEQAVSLSDNVVIKHDICEAFAQALSGSLTAMEHPGNVEADSLTSTPVHSWKENKTDVLSCASSIDVFHLLDSLKPILQDAVQKKKTSRSFGTTQHVKGPLTWREFCKEAQKNAEPQPIPSFVVGYDKDWLCVSPQSIPFWEKLFFEPYSHSQDIAYVVMCPDDKKSVNSSRLYFKEMTSVYESSHLGRFKPFNKVLKDNGILKVGESTQFLCDDPIEEWFKDYLESVKNQKKGNVLLERSLEKMVIFAKACIQSLAPILRAEPSLEISSLYVRDSRSRAHNNNINPSTNTGSYSLSGRITPLHTDSPQNLQQSIKQQQSNNNSKEKQVVACTNYNTATAATIIVYFLDPFQGLLSTAFWHCFLMLKNSLPMPMKDRVMFQIIPLETILQSTSSYDRTSLVSGVRNLAVRSFAQCRRKIPNEVNDRSMTGFGPAASEKEIAQKSKVVKVSVYSPPYVLHIPRDRMLESNVSGCPDKNCDVLFLSYCLSHNQKYVLASATDQRGELLETCCINVDVPPRRLMLTRKHRVSVRGDSIQKLWQFCVNTVSTVSTKSWRIVIGRLGRLSHGEIRDWAKFLNRKTLLVSGKRVNCSQCKLLQNFESSFITSACLVSLEAEGSLMLMPDVVQANNFGRSTNTSQNSLLKTPDDISCTHIYVFPTSAVTQHPVSNCNVEDPLGAAGQDFIPAEVMAEGMAEGEDIFKDLFNDDLMSGQISSGPNALPFMTDDDNVTKQQPTAETLMPNDAAVSEDAQLSQQPLALGYLVSTAPPGPLPAWFWKFYPEAKNRCPVFFRSALHIQATINDASNTIGVTSDQHPLDSNKTAVILRFVLENYNSLSWLCRDPVTRDRRTCLPVHFYVLMQLYQLIKKIL